MDCLKRNFLGRVKFTNSNNASVVSEYDVDYQIHAGQKVGVKTDWTSGTSAKPLTVDFVAAIKNGKKRGVSYKFAFMNVDTFEQFASQDEVIKKCSSYIQNATGTADTPDVETVNAYLAKKKELYRGLQIIVIDQEITLELADGSRVTENPFTDNVVLFSESKVLGNTYWKRPIDAKPMAGSVAEKGDARSHPGQEVFRGITGQRGHRGNRKPFPRLETCRSFDAYADQRNILEH